MTDSVVVEAMRNGHAQTSLTTQAARQLATTTKSLPQMQEISSRWLLKILPWKDVPGAVYRVNRRLVYELGDGRVTFVTEGAETRVIPRELRELSMLRDFDDEATLHALAERFRQRQLEPGDVVVERGQPADQIVLIAYGKLQKIGVGKYGEDTVLGVLTEGDHFSYRALLESQDYWQYTVRALTPATVLTLSQDAFEQLVAASEPLSAHVRRFVTKPTPPQNRLGEAAIEMASGHVGEPPLPRTFVDYDIEPREYELSVSQTVLRVHTRVSDLYDHPIDQFEEQLRLTVEALREEQEYELVNNRSFGLLHNGSRKQTISTHTGPPTPDDMDDLLARRRKTHCYLAHTKAIAAFNRECSKRGLYPEPAEVMGKTTPAWRGVPILSCNKIPISSTGTTSILALRLGEDNEGVVGLHKTGLPDEYQPGLNVRKMHVDEKAIGEYLVSTYYSVAALVPDALGILENVEVRR